MAKFAAIHSAVGYLVLEVTSQIVHIHIASAIEKRDGREETSREAGSCLVIFKKKKEPETQRLQAHPVEQSPHKSFFKLAIGQIGDPQMLILSDGLGFEMTRSQ